MASNSDISNKPDLDEKELCLEQTPRYRRYKILPAGYEDDVDDFDKLGQATSNLKISVIADISIGAALNGGDFSCDLCNSMDIWFHEYREIWNSYKRTPAVAQKLKNLFLETEDPLLLALKFFANCPDCNNLKTKSLALFILETLCELYKEHPHIAANCDDNTRIVAFNFIKTCGVLTLYKSVKETYELHKILNLLQPKLLEMLAQGQYKDVAYWAIYLNCTHWFGVCDLIFPLILQEKILLVEDYLKVAENQQLPCIKFLDSLLDKASSHSSNIVAKYNYVNVKQKTLANRAVVKLLARLAKKYKIGPEHTPHLNFSKSCSYIHYLYHKYVDGGMSTDSWRELVRDAATSEKIQLDLVNKMISCGDMEETIYWIQYYNVPIRDCPKRVQVELEKYEGTSAFVNGSKLTQYGNHKRGPNEYLELQLPDDCIIHVDDQKTFVDMLKYLKGCAIVAFDSEWKPSACYDNMVSIMQIATRERVYLVDCLQPLFDIPFWRQLGRLVFNNTRILKVGFSLHQDLCMLQKTLPLSLNLQLPSNYLDLREMWLKIKYQKSIQFPYNSDRHNGESLTVLTEICLGKKLDKSNQCSNWANRPLRRDQITYAALDAHCLLLIYEVMNRVLLNAGLNIDRVLNEIISGDTGYLIRMKSVREIEAKRVVREDTNQVWENSNVKTTDIKFICDWMLQSLTKELRKLGIDCMLVQPNMDVDQCVEIVCRERRYMLTQDARYKLFSTVLPKSQCIEIFVDSFIEQLLQIIQSFRIVVQPCNLFTRCVNCNSNEFILATTTEIMTMQKIGSEGERMVAGNVGKNSSDPLMFVTPQERTLQIYYLTNHIIATKTTNRGKLIKLNRIKPHILYNRDYIFICDMCGVCTWDGAHSLHSIVIGLIEQQRAASISSSSSVGDQAASVSSYNDKTSRRRSGRAKKRATRKAL